ncbi:unnamed protein product [Amoebophrya sp. A25]|nr:unnamed protein product [Amoebophrya sp. A25]|eukprot:GSA25T00020697001.1
MQVRSFPYESGGEDENKGVEVERTRSKGAVNGLDLLRHTCIVSRRNLKKMEKNALNFSRSTTTRSGFTASAFKRPTETPTASSFMTCRLGRSTQDTSRTATICAPVTTSNIKTGNACCTGRGAADESSSLSQLTREALAKHDSNFQDGGAGAGRPAGPWTTQPGSVGSTMPNATCSVSATESPLYSKLVELSGADGLLSCSLEAYKIAEDPASYKEWETLEKAGVMMAVAQMEWQAPSRNFFEDAQVYFFNKYHKHHDEPRTTYSSSKREQHQAATSSSCRRGRVKNNRGARGGGSQNDHVVAEDHGNQMSLSSAGYEDNVLSPKGVKLKAYCVSAVYPPIFAYRGDLLCASYAGIFSFGRVVQ